MKWVLFGYTGFYIFELTQMIVKYCFSILYISQCQRVATISRRWMSESLGSTWSTLMDQITGTHRLKQRVTWKLVHKADYKFSFQVLSLIVFIALTLLTPRLYRQNDRGTWPHWEPDCLKLPATRVQRSCPKILCQPQTDWCIGKAFKHLHAVYKGSHRWLYYGISSAWLQRYNCFYISAAMPRQWSTTRDSSWCGG